MQRTLGLLFDGSEPPGIAETVPSRRRTAGLFGVVDDNPEMPAHLSCDTIDGHKDASVRQASGFKASINGPISRPCVGLPCPFRDLRQCGEFPAVFCDVCNAHVIGSRLLLAVEHDTGFCSNLCTLRGPVSNTRRRAAIKNSDFLRNRV